MARKKKPGFGKGLESQELTQWGLCQQCGSPGLAFVEQYRDGLTKCGYCGGVLVKTMDDLTEQVRRVEDEGVRLRLPAVLEKGKVATIVLTAEMIHSAAATPPHGFTRAQLLVLGVAYPAAHGWLSGLVGREVSVELFEEFRKAGAIRGAISRPGYIPRPRRPRRERRPRGPSLDDQLTAALARDE